MASQTETKTQKLIDIRDAIETKKDEITRHGYDKPEKPDNGTLTAEYLEQHEPWKNKSEQLEKELRDLKWADETLVKEILDLLDGHRDTPLTIKYNNGEYKVTAKTINYKSFRPPIAPDTELVLIKEW